jgi:hypothetical protein
MNTFKLTRQCYNLETEELEENQKVEFDEVPQQDLEFKYDFNDRPVPE